MENHEDNPPLAHFGYLASISRENIVNLAVRVRKNILRQETSEGNFIRQIVGECNLVNIIQLDGFKLIVRVPACGRDASASLEASGAIKATVATLRFLDQRTTIPAPKVYDFDTTNRNEIGAPFICMSFLEGENLSSAWNDDDRKSPLEDRRLNTLKSLAQATAQLAPFRFNQIGSLMELGKEQFTVGPSYQFVPDREGIQIESFNPYNSWRDFVLEQFVPSEQLEANDPVAKGKMRMMNTMLAFMPCFNATYGFVLSLPDTDASNFIVDEEGHLTGIFDWDGALIVPPCLGYACYPSFITRDWDSIIYDFEKMHGQLDASMPIKLSTYREYYNQAMAGALKGHEDWKWVGKSHIRQAVFVAMLIEDCREGVCRKFIEEVTGMPEARLEVMHIGQGLYDGTGEWEELEAGLRQLISEN